jgi:hypothetical protein
LRITALAPSQAAPFMPRSRARLAALAALLAAVGTVLLVLSGADPGPLTIPIAQPAGLAVLDGRVWVSRPARGSVTPVDAEGRVGTPVRVGGTPGRVAAGANGLWVTDTASGRIVGVAVPPPDPPRATVAGPTAYAARGAGAEASDVALAAGAVWVASAADRRVYALEPDGAKTPIEAGEGPVALAADARRVVAADAPAGALTLIDARRRAYGGRVRLGGTPVDVALSGDAAWVADAARARLVRVDLGTRRISHTLAIGRRPVALASAGEDLYVLLAGDRELVKVTRGVVQWRRPVPGVPTALAVDGRHVWVGAGTLLRYGR